jgi:hypothetical protein
MENKENKLYYIIFGGLCTLGMAVGGYFIWKGFFKNEDDLDTTQDDENINPASPERNDGKTSDKKQKDSDTKSDNSSNTDENAKIRQNDLNIAMKIFTETIKAEEEAFEKIDSNESKMARIQCLWKKDDNQYIALAGGLLSMKWRLNQETKSNLLAKYKMPKEKYETLLYSIKLIDCDKYLFSFYKPNLPKNFPNKDVTKALIIEVGAKIHTLENESASSPLSFEEASHMKMIERQKIEDDFYAKKGLTIYQLKYLIHYYNMYDDQEVAFYTSYLS